MPPNKAAALPDHFGLPWEATPHRSTASPQVKASCLSGVGQHFGRGDCFASLHPISGRASGTPKTRHAQVEMIRALRVARRGAMKARIQDGGQVEALIVSAPEPVRQLVRGLAGKKRIRVCAALRPGTVSDPATATKLALRSLARRWLALQAEIDDLDSHLAALVTAAAPDLVALPGVGVDTAGQLLATAGDNPHRLHSEGAFARLCGVAPIPASSGRTDRHRLHRGGDREANRALWRITLVRMRCHQPSKDYVTRRTAEGKTKTEIMRCLKRYNARDAYRLLTADHLIERA
ncbi:transposase [Micromonospora sp. NPDC004551]|uniref:transposase n=1 Tax=Micromonospora sp. NPDC004551 TaxID=3154284 RepID=UPI0033BB8ACC